eukprot:12311635-Prorocentrum_lima.AAC.1
MAAPMEQLADEAEPAHVQPYHHAPPVNFLGGKIATAEIVEVLAPYEAALDIVETGSSAAASSTAGVEAV